MKPSDQLDLLDAAILTGMDAHPQGIMTYVVRNILVMEHGYRALQTATVRRRLVRMVRAGTVERVRSGYAVQLCWRKVLA